ncbi:HAD-IA family hydrolase [bacterium]|nr:HAD-IA family hydrolase [bacterium]
MPQPILAVCLDCGDTLIDEGTEIRNAAGIVVAAELIPTAAELMHALVERGYRLALVADGYTQSFRNILGQHGLWDLFEVYTISEELGVEKPHPAMFHTALEQLNVAPTDYGQVVMVGNNLERDIKGANELGIVSIFLDWAPRRSKVPRDASEQPGYTIKLPIELIDVLRQIEAGVTV